MDNFVQTDIVDAIDANGNVVAELDGSDVSEGAKTFAHAWHDGLIERTLDATGPTMTKDELQLLSKAGWGREGIRFMRRYYAGSRRAYPEGTRAPETNLVLIIERAIGSLAHKAWTSGLQRIETETDRLDAELAVTDAQRYAEGLAEVQQLDARNMLRVAITNMSDPVAKGAMKDKFPELFDREALSQMAQERSHAEHGEHSYA